MQIRPTRRTHPFARQTLHRGSLENSDCFLGRPNDGDLVGFYRRTRLRHRRHVSALSYTAILSSKNAGNPRGVMYSISNGSSGHGTCSKEGSPCAICRLLSRFFQRDDVSQGRVSRREEAAQAHDLTKPAGAIPSAKNPGVDVRGFDRIYDPRRLLAPYIDRVIGGSRSPVSVYHLHILTAYFYPPMYPTLSYLPSGNNRFSPHRIGITDARFLPPISPHAKSITE